MTKSGLKQLTIHHLRGSVSPFSLTFENGKKLTIVYGENGTGKSTICDAFEFLGKGKVGSLENRGLGKLNKYWPSVGRKASEVAVTIETFDNKACRGSIGNTGVVVNPEAHRPRVEVLRRSQILGVIEAKASERYAAVSRFIDVSGVEASEASIRQLIKELNESRDLAIARVQENQDVIRQFWEAKGSPGTDPLLWAATESRKDLGGSDAELQALRALQVAYSRLGEYPASLATARNALADALVKAETEQEEFQKFVLTIASDAREVMHVLESAQRYLRSHRAPSVCPLCESADKVQGLQQRISERLAAFSVLQSVQGRSNAANDTAKRAERKVEVLRENARKHAEDFQKAWSAFSWSSDVHSPKMAAPTEIEALADWLTATDGLATEWKKAEATRQDDKLFRTTLQSVLTTYNTNVDAQKALDVLLPRLTRALRVVEEERRLYTDTILAQIANDVGRIYEMVHPGEGLNKICLELDPKKRASLEIGASFCGEAGTPPQAFFSESHLDTLGLCVFLALAGMDSPENTILVLDDVLASVDEPHVERLIDMLYSETLKFRHCLITTHYRPWKQKFRWGWLRHGQCHFIELAKWTTHQGLTLIRSVPDVDRLRDLLREATPDPQLVCAKSGVILEAALDFLTQLYECKVPRRADGHYTLGDLLPAIDKKLRNSLRVEILVIDPSGNKSYQETPLAPVLNELTRISQVRNVIGCHFNALSFELLDSDALVFGDKVLELMEAIADPDAGWPRNRKSGSYWSTVGETRRLHPLTQPT